MARACKHAFRVRRAEHAKCVLARTRRALSNLNLLLGKLHIANSPHPMVDRALYVIHEAVALGHGAAVVIQGQQVVQRRGLHVCQRHHDRWIGLVTRSCACRLVAAHRYRTSYRQIVPVHAEAHLVALQDLLIIPHPAQHALKVHATRDLMLRGRIDSGTSHHRQTRSRHFHFVSSSLYI